jgi:hypothetical protein
MRGVVASRTFPGQGRVGAAVLVRQPTRASNGIDAGLYV